MKLINFNLKSKKKKLDSEKNTFFEKEEELKSKLIQFEKKTQKVNQQNFENLNEFQNELKKNREFNQNLLEENKKIKLELKKGEELKDKLLKQNFELSENYKKEIGNLKNYQNLNSELKEKNILLYERNLSVQEEMKYIL